MTAANFQSQLMSLQENLFNFALTLTANRDDACDLLQDTTVKCLTNEEKYTDDTNFKGWVFTIMRNIFINNYRRATRSQIVNDITDDCYHINVCRDTSFETPDGSMTIDEVSHAINNLEDKFRLPFSMHIAGYKYQEIAQKLNLPLGTVKSRIFFTRQQLQQRFADYAC